MDDFASDTDSDYTSYWRDWVSGFGVLVFRGREGSCASAWAAGFCCACEMEDRARFAVNDQDFENGLRLRSRGAVFGDDLSDFAGTPSSGDGKPAHECFRNSEHSTQQP
jgi:hypothetical protein